MGRVMQVSQTVLPQRRLTPRPRFSRRGVIVAHRFRLWSRVCGDAKQPAHQRIFEIKTVRQPKRSRCLWRVLRTFPAMLPVPALDAPAGEYVLAGRAHPGGHCNRRLPGRVPAPTGTVAFAAPAGACARAGASRVLH